MREKRAAGGLDLAGKSSGMKRNVANLELTPAFPSILKLVKSIPVPIYS